MGAETATPDVELDPTAADDTPETEPVDQPEDGAPEDQSAAEPDRAIGQAEYTRSQQAFSALKANLGLPRNASREDVLAAVESLREERGDEGDDDQPEPDPYVVELEQRAFQAELRAVGAIYGQDFTDSALETINLLRTTDDPNELLVAMAAFRDQWGSGAQAPAASGDEGDEGAEGEPVVPPMAGLPDDSGPSGPQPISASAARKESGAVQAIRGLFEQAGIATRTRES